MTETFKLIWADWCRYFKTQPKYNKFLILPVLFFYHPGMMFSLVFRTEHFLYCHKNPLVKIIGITFYPFYLFFTYYVLSFSIHAKTKIGGGLLMHNMDIIISDNTSVGQNATLIGPLTIGNNLNESSSPKIGDNVVVSAGARIIGNIRIGNNVIVGANSVVLKNISNDSVVAGIPAKVVKKGKNVKLQPKWNTL